MKILLENIHKNYGDKNIIKGVDLEINSGELISLLGPSGCGKTTMLMMLAGLEDVSDGKIYFGEEDVTDLSADKRNIGLVFQNYALYPHFTVLKNVMYPILNQKIKKSEAKKKALEVIESVELTDHINKLPSELSGGQQQRVAIARAIAKMPSLLLLDEPISNLDAKLKEQTSKEINNIQKKYGITSVFVTHDQQEALAVSDRIVVMDSGNIKQIGTPNELYRNPQSLYVAKFIGNPSVNVLSVKVKEKRIVGLEHLVDGELNVPNGEYKIAIRPEYFNLESEGYSICVKDVKLLGRDLNIHVKDKEIDAEIIVRNNIDVPKVVSIKVDSKDIFIFDKQTEERVLDEK